MPGYEILREIGRGGMGVVYHALQTKLHRHVALKMILAGVHAGPIHLTRFQIEAETLAGLQHPNIVQLYEVGEHDRCPYLAMEYLDGESSTVNSTVQAAAVRVLGQPDRDPGPCKIHWALISAESSIAI